MSCIYQVYTMHILCGYTMYILGYTWYIHCHGYTMYIPCISHVYTIHMDQDGIWMEYTRHIPGIYQKSGFQMLGLAVVTLSCHSLVWGCCGPTWQALASVQDPASRINAFYNPAFPTIVVPLFFLKYDARVESVVLAFFFLKNHVKLKNKC